MERRAQDFVSAFGGNPFDEPSSILAVQIVNGWERAVGYELLLLVPTPSMEFGVAVRKREVGTLSMPVGWDVVPFQTVDEHEVGAVVDEVLVDIEKRERLRRRGSGQVRGLPSNARPDDAIRRGIRTQAVDVDVEVNALGVASKPELPGLLFDDRPISRTTVEADASVVGKEHSGFEVGQGCVASSVSLHPRAGQRTEPIPFRF